jgi:hypothetical protein
MKKITLLSCLSLIPLSFEARAMEEQLSESGTGQVINRESFTEKGEVDLYVTTKSTPELLINEDIIKELSKLVLYDLNTNNPFIKNENPTTELNSLDISEHNSSPTPLIKQDNTTIESEDFDSSKYIVHTNRRLPNASTPLVFETKNNNILSLQTHSTENTKKLKSRRRNSLTLEQTKEKKKNPKRYSLSSDVKISDFFLEKTKSSEKK